MCTLSNSAPGAASPASSPEVAKTRGVLLIEKGGWCSVWIPVCPICGGQHEILSDELERPRRCPNRRVPGIRMRHYQVALELVPRFAPQAGMDQKARDLAERLRRADCLVEPEHRALRAPRSHHRRRPIRRNPRSHRGGQQRLPNRSS